VDSCEAIFTDQSSRSSWHAEANIWIILTGFGIRSRAIELLVALLKMPRDLLAGTHAIGQRILRTTRLLRLMNRGNDNAKTRLHTSVCSSRIDWGRDEFFKELSRG
jgi:hypothetical protein